MPLKSLSEAYKVLEIHNSAVEVEVKAAYKRLALLTHPDKNRDDPEAQAKFQRVSEAFQLIMDSKFGNTFDFDEDEDDEDDDFDTEAFAYDLFNFMFNLRGGGPMFFSFRTQTYGGTGSQCNCIACRLANLSKNVPPKQQQASAPAGGAGKGKAQPAQPAKPPSQPEKPPSQPKQPAAAAEEAQPFDPHEHWLSEDDVVKPASPRPAKKASKKAKKLLRKRRAANKPAGHTAQAGGAGSSGQTPDGDDGGSSSAGEGSAPKAAVGGDTAAPTVHAVPTDLSEAVGAAEEEGDGAEMESGNGDAESDSGLPQPSPNEAQRPAEPGDSVGGNGHKSKTTSLASQPSPRAPPSSQKEAQKENLAGLAIQFGKQRKRKNSGGGEGEQRSRAPAPAPSTPQTATPQKHQQQHQSAASGLPSYRMATPVTSTSGPSPRAPKVPAPPTPSSYLSSARTTPSASAIYSIRKPSPPPASTARTAPKAAAATTTTALPAQPLQPQQSQQRVMPNLEGVPLCRVFLTRHGHCKYGSTCRYSHGTAPTAAAPQPASRVEEPQETSPRSKLLGAVRANAGNKAAASPIDGSGSPRPRDRTRSGGSAEDAAPTTGHSEGKGGGNRKTKPAKAAAKEKTPAVCLFANTAEGCKNGDKCKFPHTAAVP